MEEYLCSFTTTIFVFVPKNFEARIAKIGTIAPQIPVKTELPAQKFLVRLSATVPVDF